MLSVAHNISAMDAQRQFNIVNNQKAKSTEKLSSGYKINRAADDAAGLAISEKLRRQIRGLNQGAENIQDGVSLCQVADGALAEVDDLLHRMNELSIKAANGTNTNEDRAYIQQEVDSLVGEINRIGKDTTFNEIHIFDIDTIEAQVGKITKLVTSPGGDAGYLSEAYPHNGKYYSSTSIDFSNINDKNISKLNNGSFSFTCSFACSETFEITFKTDGTPSDNNSAQTKNKKTTHSYTVDISQCKSGSDVVNATYDYIQKNPARDSKDASSLGGLLVSHSNVLLKSNDGNKLIVAGTEPYNTESEAKIAQKGRAPYGVVDCTGLTQTYYPEPVFTFRIQCSSNVDDAEYVNTRWMNGEALNVDPLDVSTEISATNAIRKIKYGMEYIADLRSSLGSQQNRLVHSYNNNLNTAENTQAAESQIRDTDMAKEMVKFSNQDILSQAGISMMSQANQQNQIVLSLLQ